MFVKFPPIHPQPLAHQAKSEIKLDSSQTKSRPIELYKSLDNQLLNTKAAQIVLPTAQDALLICKIIWIRTLRNLANDDPHHIAFQFFA